MCIRDRGHSEWQGKLAEHWGLEGAVGNEHFARLTEGQHPHTEAQLVRHQVSKTYEGKFGKEVTSVEHRAGWDATFSAPKSVSLTALVGGDERVREAHRESVRVALSELERYTQPGGPFKPSLGLSGGLILTPQSRQFFHPPSSVNSAATPVSYTHLDVYKRQGMAIVVNPRNLSMSDDQSLHRR